MKKFTFVCIAAATLFMMGSCGNKAKKAEVVVEEQEIVVEDNTCCEAENACCDGENACCEGEVEAEADAE